MPAALALLLGLAACGEAPRETRAPASGTRAAVPAPTSGAVHADGAEPPDRTPWPPLVAGVSFCASDDEPKALACARGRAWRHGDSLVIRPDSGPVLVDLERPDTGGTVYEHHTYAGAIVGRAIEHVVSDAAYESSDTRIVDGRSGRSVGAIGPPLLSPAGDRFAASAMSLETCEGRNGLEIWRLTDSIPVREFALDAYDCKTDTGWGPTDLAWQSADTLALTAVLAPNDSLARQRGITERWPVTLVRSAAGWRVMGLRR